MTSTTTQSPWAAKMERVRRQRPAEAAVTICTDPDTIATRDDALHRLRDARRKAAQQIADDSAGIMTPVSRDDVAAAVEATPQVIAAGEYLARAQAAVDDATVEFYFRALPGEVYEALASKYPPDDDDRKAGRPVDMDAFAPVIMAACHVYREQTGVDDDGRPVYAEHPGMTEDDAREILRIYTQGNRQTLVAAAVAVNQTSQFDYVSLGKGSGLTTH